LSRKRSRDPSGVRICPNAREGEGLRGWKGWAHLLKERFLIALLYMVMGNSSLTPVYPVKVKAVQIRLRE